MFGVNLVQDGYREPTLENTKMALFQFNGYFAMFHYKLAFNRRWTVSSFKTLIQTNRSFPWTTALYFQDYAEGPATRWAPCIPVHHVISKIQTGF